MDRWSDDAGLVELDPLALAEPEVTRDGVLGDHQGADRQAAGDVEERRVAPLVGGRVIGAESDRPVAAVVVDREVAQLSVPAVHDRAADEVGAQHPVAALPRHVVDAVLSEEQVAPEEAQPTLRAGDAGGEHGAVLIAVPGEQVGPEAVPKALRKHQRNAGAGHGRSFSHSSTFCSFIAAVSRVASR